MGENGVSFRVLRRGPPASKTPDHTSKSDRNEKARTDGALHHVFGTVYLGQTLTLAVAFINHSPHHQITNIGIKIEIQSDYGKSILFDSMASERRILSLASGEHFETELKFEIRGLGDHTLLCSASYTISSTTAEPGYHPHVLKFQAFNPLVVKTKHRPIANGGGGGGVLLEATIENKTMDVMILQSVDVITSSSGYSAKLIAPPPPLTKEHPLTSLLGDHHITSLPLLHPGGGATSYVFRLERIWRGASNGGSDDGDEDGAVLGKLDIRWQGPLGDHARLQTQAIGGGVARPQRELRLELESSCSSPLQPFLPKTLTVARPFELAVVVVSAAERRLGPLKVSYHHSSAVVSNSSSNSNSSSSAEGIVMDGLQSVEVAAVEAFGRSAVLRLKLIPMRSGRQCIQGIMLTDARDGRVFDSLAPIEVFVDDY